MDRYTLDNIADKQVYRSSFFTRKNVLLVAGDHPVLAEIKRDNARSVIDKGDDVWQVPIPLFDRAVLALQERRTLGSKSQRLVQRMPKPRSECVEAVYHY